jgi:hypothetical protein
MRIGIGEACNEEKQIVVTQTQKLFCPGIVNFCPGIVNFSLPGLAIAEPLGRWVKVVVLEGSGPFKRIQGKTVKTREGYERFAT